MAANSETETLPDHSNGLESNPKNVESLEDAASPHDSYRKRALSQSSSLPSSPCVYVKRAKFTGYRSSTPMSLATFMKTEFSFDDIVLEDIPPAVQSTINTRLANRVGATSTPISERIRAASVQCSDDCESGDDRELDDKVASDKNNASYWSMHQATSEAEGSEIADKPSEDFIAPGMEIDFSTISLQRGQSYQTADGTVTPGIAYTNLKKGRTFQALVDRKILELERIVTWDIDPEKPLWQQTSSYTESLSKRCLDNSEVPGESFPILHRHGNHLEVTSSPFTKESIAPSGIKKAVKKEWERLGALYSDLDYLGDEHRALIDKAYNLLGYYQQAVASRKVSVYMELNDLLGPFKAAFDELSMTEYVVREIFYSKNHYPRFLSAIEAV